MNFSSYTEWLDTGKTKKQKVGISEKRTFNYVNDIGCGNKKHVDFIYTTA